jgi:predicted anti-sigma-YlaC factor YlaD
MNTEVKLSCKEVSRILSDGLDADMRPPLRARLRLHLVMCEACRNVEQQFDLLRRLVRRSEPSGDAKDDGGGADRPAR